MKIFKTDDDHKRFAWTKNEYNYRAKSYLNDTSSYMYVRRRYIIRGNNFVNFRVKSI